MNRAPASFRIMAANGTVLRVGRIDPAVLQESFDTEGAHARIRALRAANPGQPGPIAGGLVLIGMAVITALLAVIARGIV